MIVASEHHPSRLLKASMAVNMQTVVLLLLIVLAGIQAAELFGIERASASLKPASPVISAGTAAPPASGALPQQVGGC